MVIIGNNLALKVENGFQVRTGVRIGNNAIISYENSIFISHDLVHYLQDRVHYLQDRCFFT